MESLPKDKSNALRNESEGGVSWNVPGVHARTDRCAAYASTLAPPLFSVKDYTIGFTGRPSDKPIATLAVMPTS
jgi:hypothetical protein